MHDELVSSGSSAETAPVGEDLRCTCAALRRTARRVTQVYDDALKPVGLKLTQYIVLNAIAKVEQPSITDLAARLMMDRTTLTRNLRPLEAAGWAALRHGRDARSRTAILTEEGRRVLQAAWPVWRETELAVRGRLGPDGGRSLRTLLEQASAAVANG